MTKLLSSGFPVQKPDRQPAKLVATPETPKISQGLTGQAHAAAKPCDGAYIYNWRAALAETPDTFVQQKQSTGAKATFDGLTRGETYVFQLNAVGTAGTSDWSNAGSMMVI
ncbi:MAG: fibronectin type III domain-containing protein [Chthoniobacterales bacterium]